MEDFICPFCEKVCKNKNSVVQHQIRCKSNPNAIKVTPSYGMRGKTGSNQFIKAASEGRSITVSDETRKKISDASKLQEWCDERRKKHSESMRQAVMNHPESYSASNVSGRVKNIEYNGRILKGNWELIVAEYLDSINIRWDNSIEPFPYNWNDSVHLYFPDFYLLDYDVYIEVKGYQVDRDLFKWKAVPNLIVLKDEEIKMIRNGDFDIYSFFKN